MYLYHNHFPQKSNQHLNMQNVYIFLEILDVISDFLTSNALGAYF